MAKLRINQSIDGNDYVFQFAVDPDSISTNDKAALDKFSEPDINFGGIFTGTSNTTFTLPNQYVKLISGLPLVIKFSPVDPFDTYTEDKLTLYRTTMATRFNDAFVMLRTTTDSFTGEYVTNI
jgi:hypothetical protein